MASDSTRVVWPCRDRPYGPEARVGSVTKLGALTNHPVQASNTALSAAAFSPAFALVAACCQWPPSAFRHAAIRAAATRIADWNDFLLTVKRHRVAGLVHSALLLAEAKYPPVIAAKIAWRARRVAQQNLKLKDETLRLQAVFEAAHVPALALKGVALAQLAYGSVLAKQGRDIDFLVSPESAETALQLLEQDGYAPSSPAKHLNPIQRRNLIAYGKEIELRHKDHQTIVELQWRAANNALLLRDVDAHSPAQAVKLSDGHSLRTLAPNDLFAYLCVHGAHHSWSRLKWLSDVNALVAAEGADIEGFYDHAERAGAGLCAAQTLLLCQQILALPLPSQLAAELSQDKRVRRLVDIALAAVTMPQSAESGIGGVVQFVGTQFLLGRGWKFYAEQCRVASVGPIDVIRLPLPRYLHFLYPVIRLPLWLWRRTLTALGWNVLAPR